MSLSGIRLVLTGVFEAHPRAELARLLTELGATVVGSVSGTTTALVAGREPGESKLAAARARGLPVLDEARVLALLAGGTWDEALVAGVVEEPTNEPAGGPLPFVAQHPRDGEYVERYPGSDTARVSGAYRDGLRDGAWRRFAADGSLVEDIGWDRGVKHGPVREWNTARRPGS